MYILEKGNTLDFLKIINKFLMNEQPKLKKYMRYYNGDHDINRKEYTDSNKPCNKITTNFCSTITNNYLGYLTGKGIGYNIDNPEILDVLKYNDYNEEDKELLRQALITGYAAELFWIDDDMKVRFSVMDSREIIPVYWDTIGRDELAAVIRFYWSNDSEQYHIEVYEQDYTRTYTADATLKSCAFVDETVNYFNQIPVVILDLGSSVFAQVMGLNDAYNSVLSGEIDDFDTFADAYLVMSGMDNVETEDLVDMRRNKCIIIPDAGSVSYLTKDINDVQIENILNNLKKNIYLISNCADFSDEAFGTASGVAMEFKLLGMENNAGVIEKHMIKALQKRIELICDFLSLVNGEEIWRDVQFTFERNIPVDLATKYSSLVALRGLVSARTLLSQIDFVKDIDKELELVKEEGENTVYDFTELLG